MKVVQRFSKKDNRVYKWLLSGCVLIILMVVIGGITRLTQSGLSMVDWKPIMGVIPPMSESEWQEVFEMYKQSPEFHHYNSHFTLSDFKSIYFWEYLHRLLARITGLVFLIPCALFWMQGYFSGYMKKQVLIIFALGAFQGVLGWVMVKSGLVDEPHVSHYRLAAHLVTALGLMMYIFWVALRSKYVVVSDVNLKLRKIILFVIGFIVLQIVYGAFVAGLKAGLIYTTFPKMGTEWIPEVFGHTLSEEGWISIMKNPGIVQFIHRLIGIGLLLSIVFVWIRSARFMLEPMQKRALRVLTVLILTQIILGVITLLYSVPVVLGVLHQFVAILILSSTIFLLFTLTKKAI